MAVLDPLTAERKGRHLCARYSSDQERAGIAARFVAEGLAASEKVGYVTGDAPSTVTGSLSHLHVAHEAALASGQLMVLALADMAPDADGSRVTSLAAAVQAFVEDGMREGYPALRIASEVHALAPSHETLDQMRARENLATQLTESLPLTGMCLYDSRLYAPDFLLAAEREHAQAAATDTLYADALVTITAADHRQLRIVGDIDLSNAGALRTALAGVAERTADGMVVDVSGIHFIDVAGLRAIADTAADRADLRMTLHGADPDLVLMLRLSGWDDLPNLVVVPMGGDR